MEWVNLFAQVRMEWVKLIRMEWVKKLFCSQDVMG